jgi:DNA polymerase elongation subunit (family B)
LYALLTEKMQKLWTYRTNRFKPNDVPIEQYYFDKAGVYGEFGKVVCISVGFFAKPNEGENYKFRVKSFYGDDEAAVLLPFIQLLDQHFLPEHTKMCGHNITEFDVPFLARRILINGLPMPQMFNVSSFKPWEVPFVDTMRIWKFGEYRNYTSLQLLSTVLDIPDVKNDMDGSEVATVYWHDKNLERIRQYCETDVLAVAQVLLRFKGQELLKDEEIVLIV